MTKTTIESLILQLYDQDAYANIMQVVEQINLPPSNQPHELYSERDVFLITYADSLKKTDQSPLQTLLYFSQKYLKGVINTIHILPFYPSSSDDGFSVKDFYAVDESLGTWDDIGLLGKDFKLMFDAVFNHGSAQGKWFQSFLKAEKGYEQLFLTAAPDTDLSSVTRPRTSPLLHPFTTASGETIHVWTTFSADQVDFDIRHPTTFIHLLKVLFYYIERGASAIRLDAIAYLWKSIGTSSINLEETHKVIQLLRAILDEVAPYVILITETNIPHTENISYFGNGTNEAQLVYNFTLPPLLIHTLLSQNANQLGHWINTLKTPSNQTTFFNFTASHDGIGVRPVEGILSPNEMENLINHVERQGGRVSYKQNSDGSFSPYELNISYMNATSEVSLSASLNLRRFWLSQAIALSMAGIPAVYIHSLLGSQNDLVGVLESGINRRVNREKLYLDTLNMSLDQTDTLRSQVLRGYLHLIQTRIAQREFHPNSEQKAILLNSGKVLVILRSYQGSAILAVYNVTPHTQQVDLSDYFTTSRVDTISGSTIQPHPILYPYDLYWIKLTNYIESMI